MEEKRILVKQYVFHYSPCKRLGMLAPEDSVKPTALCMYVQSPTQCSIGNDFQCAKRLLAHSEQKETRNSHALYPSCVPGLFDVHETLNQKGRML